MIAEEEQRRGARDQQWDDLRQDDRRQDERRGDDRFAEDRRMDERRTDAGRDRHNKDSENRGRDVPGDRRSDSRCEICFRQPKVLSEVLLDQEVKTSQSQGDELCVCVCVCGWVCVWVGGCGWVGTRVCVRAPSTSSFLDHCILAGPPHPHYRTTKPSHKTTMMKLSDNR